MAVTGVSAVFVPNMSRYFTLEVTRFLGDLCDFGISASRENVNSRKQKGCVSLRCVSSVICLPLISPLSDLERLFFAHLSSLARVLPSELLVSPSRSASCVTPLCRFSVQSDIYAFGMFLYEVLTHHFPFENFVTEDCNGSELSQSKQHWSLADVHKPHAQNNARVMSRLASKAEANLCIPDSILNESPTGFVELLRKCISVRVRNNFSYYVSVKTTHTNFIFIAVQPIGSPSNNERIARRSCPNPRPLPSELRALRPVSPLRWRHFCAVLRRANCRHGGDPRDGLDWVVKCDFIYPIAYCVGAPG